MIGDNYFCRHEYSTSIYSRYRHEAESMIWHIVALFVASLWDPVRARVRQERVAGAS